MIIVYLVVIILFLAVPLIYAIRQRRWTWFRYRLLKYQIKEFINNNPSIKKLRDLVHSVVKKIT